MDSPYLKLRNLELINIKLFLYESLAGRAKPENYILVANRNQKAQRATEMMPHDIRVQGLQRRSVATSPFNFLLECLLLKYLRGLV